MRSRTVAGAVSLVMVLAACGSDADDPDSSAAGTSGELAVLAGEAFPTERCAANEDAGTITYLTGFDFDETAVPEHQLSDDDQEA